jgi:protein-L-isoaspartate O-methyltransferase
LGGVDLVFMVVGGVGEGKNIWFGKIMSKLVNLLELQQGRPLLPAVARVFQSVDRRGFLPRSLQSQADSLSPLFDSVSRIHQSAINVYMTILEHAQPQPGQSFLNVGSGSGYFSCLVYEMMDRKGIVDNIEILSDVVEFVKTSDFTKKYNMSVILGNAFDISPKNERRYDWIYVGARINPSQAQFFQQFLKKNGRLFAPLNSSFVVRFEDGRTVELFPCNFREIITAPPGPPIFFSSVSKELSEQFPTILPMKTNVGTVIETKSIFWKNAGSITSSNALPSLGTVQWQINVVEPVGRSTQIRFGVIDTLHVKPQGTCDPDYAYAFCSCCEGYPKDGQWSPSPATRNKFLQEGDIFTCRMELPMGRISIVGPRGLSMSRRLPSSRYVLFFYASSPNVNLILENVTTDQTIESPIIHQVSFDFDLLQIELN